MSSKLGQAGISEYYLAVGSPNTKQHSDLTVKELELQVSSFKHIAASLVDQATTEPASAQPQGAHSHLSEQPQSRLMSSANGKRTGDNGIESDKPDKQQPSVLVTTDSCLKALGRDVVPFGLTLLVQYDLPSNKEVYMRRMSSVFGGAKERRGTKGMYVVIDVVVAGFMDAFRELESFSVVPIQEMPVQVNDMFLATA